ncbi:myotilin isoform X1 [Lepisosteus oculatus]|uniref:myotilin isoform X1 n=2 Tax=Lepisosteus oculatus TaxID=7918 RepID=UPI0035F510DA
MTHFQKKTTTMSLTISSCSRESSSGTGLQQRHSSLVQPLRISSPRMQSPSYSQHSSGNGGVAPSFVKCLHDVSTVKGQLVVLECRVRGTPPLQVLWYREEEQIVDSADFRILKKKASSVSVPEEVCTLVITEAFPEDSGMFKCVAGNQYGTVSCSALLDVYSGLEEVLAHEETTSSPAEPLPDTLPSFPHGAVEIPPPEWPDSPEEDSEPCADPCSEGCTEQWQCTGTPAEEQHRPALGESRVPPPACTLPSQRAEEPASPRHPSSQRDPPGDMSMADFPSFSPTSYPPSAFNYERPRHFIQAQPRFQAPSYESLQPRPPQASAAFPNGHRASPSSSTLSSPVSTPSSSLGSPREPPAPRPASPSRGPMKSSITLVPRVCAGAPSQSPAAFISSVLPCPAASQSMPASVPPPRPPSPAYSPRSPTPPRLSPPVPQSASGQPASLPANHRPAPAVETFPRQILKKKSPRPASHTTDEEIQGSKDALIQDLEKKLRCKEARRRNGSQKLTYEERMARRLLGPDSAASVFDIEGSQDSQTEQNSPDRKHTSQGQQRNMPESGSEDPETASIQEKCYAPRFLQVPQDLTVEEGRFCRIDFKVGGLPTPDVSWYLNGKLIGPDDYHKMLVCEKGVHSFIIEIVTVHHAGEYECVARNRAGESRFTLHLSVIAQELQRPPVFVRKMQNSRALEGDSVRLECQVSASPPPQLYWKKDKEMMRVDPGRMSLYQDNSGRLCLLIDRVEKADAGWYTVSAINEAGMSTCNARLDVGTRLTKAATVAKPLKVRPTFSQGPALAGQGAGGPRQQAPLCESEEL